VRRRHHELVAWQVSIELVGDLYRLTETFPATETYGLASQIRRAAISVPSNIAEGAARTTKRIDNDEEVQQKLDRVFGLIGGLVKSIRTTD
jgi:hypothetical protein